ncbi:MAG: MBL fold metallo-hydrolase, partial [Acidobacteriota bacterium]
SQTVVEATRKMRVSFGSFAAAAGSDRTDLSLTLLDVGEGDCNIIRFPDGRLWVLDAGGLRGTSFSLASSDVFDIGEAVVSRYLWTGWGAHPDLVILSHTDIDHAGGIAALLRNFRIRSLEYPKCIPDAFLNGLLETAKSRGTNAKPIFKGRTEEIGAVRLRVLHPPEIPVKPSTNDSSLVIRMSYKRFSAILTGDLGIKGEAALLSYDGILSSHLLKVAHHGSASGTSSAFLDAVNPRWAFLSSGRNNSFGHPSPVVLSRLQSHGTGVFQTAKEGALTFRTDGIRYEIHSHINGVLEKGELPE